MALTADQVQKFYIGYYARPADPVGLTYWQTQDEAAALKGFSGSAEFTNQFTGLSASQQVTRVYNNLLGRAPDAAGLLYWAGELTAGRETIGTLVLSMTKNALGKDVTTIEDRVSYSKSFTAALDTPAEINAYAGTVATQTARDALLKVVANSVGDHTALNAEVKNIDATVATIVSGGGGTAPGASFALTAGTDFANTSTAFINNAIPSDFKFTNANETVEALNGTLAAVDTLIDASTADNDVINVRVGANAPVFGTLQNIETINLIATNGVAMVAGTALNLANVTGAKAFNASGTLAGALTINNAGTTGITTYDFSGITTTGANGAVTLNMGTTTPTAALKITGGAGNDVLTGGSGDDVMVGGAGNDTLNAGGGNNTVDVGAGGGAQFVTFSNGNNNVKATGATGAVTVTGGNGANTVEVTSAGGLTVTLGSGANTITSGGGADAVTVGNGANTIVTGAGNDVIAVGTGANTITAGAGADQITTAANSSSTIVIGAGDSAVNGGALATADVISGFTTNGDKLKLGLTDGTGTNYVEATPAAAADLAAAVVLADAALDGTVQYYLMDMTNATVGNASFALVAGAAAAAAADSILFVDRDLDGTHDQIVYLVGVNSATFAATDIIA